MTLTTGTSRLIMFTLLTAGCAPAAGPSGGDGDGDGTTNGITTATSGTTDNASTDLDNDGIPDHLDDFIDLDGDGIDDRQQSNVIDNDGDGRPDCVPGLRGTSQVPRLKNVEYDRTIRDLVGLTRLNGSSPSALLATDQGGSLTDLGWSSYQTVGAQIAKQVMSDATMKAKFLKCDPAASECISSTITTFGRRAFRRALNQDEIARFTALAVPANTPNGTADEVAELLLHGFLISPSFLMRSEITESAATSSQYVLSGPEIASRLSYMLWGSMPDETLDEAADTNQLITAPQILAQAQRMIVDDKARDMVAEFHRRYLHMGVNTRWDTFVKDPARFPSFNEALRPALSQETEMFFDAVVFGNGGFKDLFLSTQGFVNSETAALYGIDAAGLGSELSARDLPGRPGFLTRIGFLGAFSQATRTSPILRGAYIVKDVLGTKIDTPPPGVEGTPLPDSPDLVTNRDRVDAQTADATCMECHHEHINPAGFLMEAFDTMGQPQSTEADTGAAIDTSATIMIDGKPTFASGPIELMSLIASSSAAQYFYAQKWVSHAFGRSPNSQDACTVELLSPNLSKDGYSILNLIADLTQANSFAVRALETGVSP